MRITTLELSSDKEDGSLVNDARGGDKTAFVELVSRHQKMVTGISLAILRDFQASEDVAQEAFVTAWKKLNDLRDPKKFKSWLAHIARTTALMHLRKRRPINLTESIPEQSTDPSLSPDAVTAQNEERALVIAALNALPENYRLPMVLFYREDRSVASVAESLDLNEAVVKKRLSRGREKLRQHVVGLLGKVLEAPVPNALFTASVASAIGAMMPPSAVAATAFTATSQTGAAATSVGAPTLTATTMTTSKFSLTTAALISAVCLPIGYSARIQMEAPPEQAPMISEQTSRPLVDDPKPVAPPESELVAEWKRLRKEHGEGPDGLQPLYDIVNSIPDSAKRRAFLAVLVSEWIRENPIMCIATMRQGDAPEWLWEVLVTEGLKYNANGSIDLLMANRNEPNWQRLAREALGKIATHAPSRLAEVVEQLPKPRNIWDQKVRDAFEIMGTQNLENARAAAESVTGENRAQALAGLAMAWAQKDGKTALEWASTLEGTERRAVVTAALLGWAKHDPISALERVDVLPPGGNHNYVNSTVSEQVLRMAGKTDFEATAAWLRDNPGRVSDSDALSSEIDTRLFQDPAGFLSNLQSNGTLEALLDGIQISMLNDTSSVRKEVWQWTLDAPESEVVLGLQKRTMNSLTWQEPETALKLLSSHPPGKAKDQMTQEMGNNLFNSHDFSHEQFDRLLPLAPEDLQAVLVEKVFQHLPKLPNLEPGVWTERVAWLPPEKRPQAVRHLASGWAQSDPSSSFDWVQSLSSETEKAQGTEAVFSQWAGLDQEEATKAFQALSHDSERDSAAAGMAQTLIDYDTEQAWQWIEAINSPERRQASTHQFLTQMANDDPAHSLEWVEQSSFSPDEKEHFRQVIEAATEGN